MGNSANSTLVDQQIKDVLAEYEILQQVTNENITYLEHKKTNKEYLLRQMTFNDKNQFNKAFENLKKKKAELDGCQHVTPLAKYMTKSEDQFCATFYKIYALFQYPQRTLDDEISQRNLQKRRFQQRQLWSILASCILGLSHLQKQGIKHMSLRSNNIMLSHQGIIKIADPYTTGALSNYDTLLNKRTTPHIYLSPQQADSIQKELIAPNCNPYKADIWSLGLIMLQAGLLQYQDQCYRDEGSRIHWETLNYNINRFGQNYSQQLRSMIEFMLSKDERTRPQWIQLQEHVMKVDQGVRGSYVGQDNEQNRSSFQPFHSNVQHHQEPNSRAPKLVPYSKTQAPLHSNATFSTGNANVSPNFHVTKLNSGVKSSVVRQNQTFSPIRNSVQSNSPYVPYNSTFNPNISSAPFASVKVSNIENTRPTRSFFPTDTYIQQTRIDENLIVVGDDQQTRADEEKGVSGLMNSGINHNFNQNQIINSRPYNNRITSNADYQTGSFGHSNQQLYNTSSNQHRITNNQPSYKQNTKFTTGNQNQPEFKIQVFKMGSKYQGYKLNGMRHGQGKFYYQDGGMYDGQWSCNRMQGYGKLYYQSGKLAYQGQWIRDQFTGHGILYNQQPQHLDRPFNYRNFDEVDQFWTKYEGNFFQDNKHGKGKLYLSNGQYFEGQFKNDLLHGNGVFYSLDGKRISGMWNQNRLI